MLVFLFPRTEGRDLCLSVISTLAQVLYRASFLGDVTNMW